MAKRQPNGRSRSEVSRELWARPAYRELQRQRLVERWQEPEYRARMAKRFTCEENIAKLLGANRRYLFTRARAQMGEELAKQYLELRRKCKMNSADAFRTLGLSAWLEVFYEDDPRAVVSNLDWSGGDWRRHA